MAQTSQSNSQKAAFLGFMEEYRDVTDAVAEAVGMRKDLRARMKGEAVNMKSFDQVWKDADKSGDLRQKQHNDYCTYMGWLGKPLDATTAPATDISDPSDMQRTRVEEAGFLAGKSNYAAEANPWSPGTELNGVWADGWARGKATLDEGDNPKPRGRPRGARNRATTHDEESTAAVH